MYRAIVTVQRQGESASRDLEVPCEVPAEQLAALLVQALQCNSGGEVQRTPYEIVVQPHSRLLQSHESLADVGAWDGVWLVLRPALGSAGGDRVSAGRGRTPERGEAPARGPVAGWRPLGVDVPSREAPGEPAPEPEQPASGYVWKRLDGAEP
ncbi:MAG: hypothetical protein HYY04_18460 [Chloroflexi bacterium]|nr:hypothetical protein [Chloroflexota bacterium]